MNDFDYKQYIGKEFNGSHIIGFNPARMEYTIKVLLEQGSVSFKQIPADEVLAYFRGTEKVEKVLVSAETIAEPIVQKTESEPKKSLEEEVKTEEQLKIRVATVLRDALDLYLLKHTVSEDTLEKMGGLGIVKPKWHP